MFRKVESRHARAFHHAEALREEVPFRVAGFGRWIESFRRGETVHGLVRDFPESERIVLSAQGVRALAVVPVQLDGHLWGFLAFDNCEAEREWSQREILGLRVAADMLAEAIAAKERAALIESSEERYRALFERSLGLLCTHSMDGTLLTVNNAAASNLGLTVEQMIGRKLDWRYLDEARKGDHICYISNLAKFQNHYPNWKITRGLDSIFEEIITSQREQLARTTAK